MSRNPRTVFEQILPRFLREHGGGALPDNVRIAFHIQGVDGGDWQVARSGGETIIGEVSETMLDCVVRCSASVFMDIVEGRVDHREAFMRGDLRMSGDVGLALRLQSVLRSAA